MLRIYLLLIASLISIGVFGQYGDQIETLTIWKYNSESKSKSIVINECTGRVALIKESSILRVLTDGYERILRLTKGDTVILICIPQIDNVQPPYVIEQITSISMLLDDSNIGATYIDEFNVGPSSFGEKFFKIAREQTPRRDYYAKEIGMCNLSIDPEAIQIELTCGPYGDMTLIYTANSPIPQITIH